MEGLIIAIKTFNMTMLMISFLMYKLNCKHLSYNKKIGNKIWHFENAVPLRIFIYFYTRSEGVLIFTPKLSLKFFFVFQISHYFMVYALLAKLVT